MHLIFANILSTPSHNIWTIGHRQSINFRLDFTVLLSNIVTMRQFLRVNGGASALPIRKAISYQYIHHLGIDINYGKYN